MYLLYDENQAAGPHVDSQLTECACWYAARPHVDHDAV